MTDGIFREMSGKWCIGSFLSDSRENDPVNTILFFELMQSYLPSKEVRRVIRVPQFVP